MARRRGRWLLLIAGLLVVVVAGGLLVARSRRPGLTPAEIAAQRAAAARARLIAHERSLATDAASFVAATLPRKAGSLAPSTPAPLFAKKTRTHLVLGFAPYWLVDQLTAADYANTSILAWYGLELSASGAPIESGPAWTDLGGSSFGDFLAQARSAHDRVLLSVATADPTVIAGLLRDPAHSAARLAAALSPLIAADGFAGVDVDIEGRAGKERAAFVQFCTVLDARLRAARPGLELVLDTFPQSATEKKGFFDLAHLAPLFSQLFVMGYDMYDRRVASANAPLLSPTLGFSDTQTVLDYDKIVAPAKLILGEPFYGYRFKTASTGPHARSLSASPIAENYVQIVAAGRAARWDPESYTPYTVASSGAVREETWFDDPVSLALKTALALRARWAGVGVWALGAEGDAPAMLAALDGSGPPLKLKAPGA